MEAKFSEKIDGIEVLTEKPYHAIAHVGKTPSVLCPRQTKSANCSQYPGAHKAGKSKCEHLCAYSNATEQEEMIKKQHQ